MTTPPQDQAARDRAAGEQERSLAVEAGAGTGKTTLLVERILVGLEQGKYAMSEVAAITFTRKAAAELRARLRRGLAERIASLEGEQAERMAEAQRLLPLAQISTIHSFCGSILSEYPLLAGLVPGYRVAEDSEGRELADSLWGEWFALQLEDDARAEPFIEVLGWGASLDAFETLARDLQELVTLMLPERGPKAPSGEALWNKLTERVREFVDQLHEARTTEESDTLEERFLLLRDELDRLELLSPQVRLRWLLDLHTGKTFSLPHVTLSQGKKGNYAPGVLDEIRADLRTWRDSEIPALVREHFAAVVRRALVAMARFRDWALEQRLERGLISQSDLLSLAEKLLRTKKEVRRALCRRFKVLLVDEYQDTDPIQARIVRLLRSEKEGPVIFLVGDPKQSIYRFRQADVQTYQEDVGRLDEDGCLERISVNFRSTPRLLEAIGRLFAEIFVPALYPGGQAEWQPLLASPGKVDGEGAALVLAPVGGGERIGAEEAACQEAQVLAREIRQAHDADGVPWSDMAVLFPVAKRAHLLENAFDELEIPFRQEKSQHFFRRAEVAEIAAVVAATADPWDERLVVAALRTRLFGVSDQVLARHSAGGGSFQVADFLGTISPVTGEGAVLDALGTLAGWNRCSVEESPPALVERILDETRFLLLLEGLPHGDRASGNVRKLLDQARDHWARGGYGLANFAGWLRDRTERELSREAESPAAEDEERVTLLTIHAAKGLQWKVVGLFAASHTPRSQPNVGLRDRETGQLELRFARFLESPGYEAVHLREKELEKAEKARLLYVALTRAAERLILPFPAVPSRDSGSLLAVLRQSKCWRSWEEDVVGWEDPEPPHVIRAPSLAPPAPLETADSAPGSVPNQPGRVLGTQVETADSAPGSLPNQPGRVGGDQAITRALLLREAWSRERAALLESADRAVVVTPSELHDHAAVSAPSGNQSHGREIGSAVHQALEWWVLAGGGGSGVDELADRAANRAGLEGEKRQRVKLLVRRGVESPLVQRALRAERCLPEMPFAWRTPENALPSRVRDLLAEKLSRDGRPPMRDEASISIEGIVDLVFEEGGGLVVVDYKTDAWQQSSDLDQLVACYAPQIAAYASALEASMGLPVCESWLLFLGGAEIAERKCPGR